MNGLTIKTLGHEITERGSEADVILTERNGDEYKLRVLVKPSNEIEIGDPYGGETLHYLVGKYSPQVISLMHNAVLHCV